MICQKCMHNFNTTNHLPLIDKTGKTQCKECSLKLTAFSKNKELSLNKELIKIMGKCPEHLDTDLSLYDVYSRKRRCPKCIIFCADKGKFKDTVFVEIDNNQNSIDCVMSRQVQKACSKIEEIERKFVQSAKSIKEQVRQVISLDIEKKHKELISQLTKLYEKELSSVNNKIQQIWGNSWQETLKYFKILQEKCQEYFKNQPIEVKGEEKYEKISQAVKLYMDAVKIEQSVGLSSEVVRIQIKKFQNDFKCGLNVNFETEIEESKELEMPLKKYQSAKQQLLIEASPIEFPEVNYIQILPIKCNTSVCTERTERASQSASEDNFSVSSGMSMKLIDKSVLILKNPQEINKIDTHIKEIEAKNLQIGNTQAKKILNSVNKSFAKGLDLSNNKLTGIFLKDLNKANIGKYLKWIKLKGNPIDLKDAAIIRKVDQLKNQGVNIIF